MNAAKKMTAFGLKAISHKAGVNLVTVYRWKRALESGLSVRDVAKKKLIEATAESSSPIWWSDFEGVAK